LTWVCQVCAIVVLLFGAKKIPDLAKGMGKGIKDFKKAIKEDEEEPKEIATKETDVPEAKIEEKKSAVYAFPRRAWERKNTENK